MPSFRYLIKVARGWSVIVIVSPFSSNSCPEISVLSDMSKRETRCRAADPAPVSGTGRIVGEGKREISSVGIPQRADWKLVQPQDPTIFEGYQGLCPHSVAAFLRIEVARIDRELADSSKTHGQSSGLRE